MCIAQLASMVVQCELSRWRRQQRWQETLSVAVVFSSVRKRLRQTYEGSKSSHQKQAGWWQKSASRARVERGTPRRAAKERSSGATRRASAARTRGKEEPSQVETRTGILLPTGNLTASDRCPTRNSAANNPLASEGQHHPGSDCCNGSSTMVRRLKACLLHVRGVSRPSFRATDSRNSSL